MHGEPRSLPGADLTGFVHEVAAFIDFGEDDMAVVRRTAPVILQHERVITDGLYDRFLTCPETARFFLLPDGTPDHPRLERRKHSLGRWLHATAEAALTHEFSYYLLAIGLAHSHRSHGPGGKIPPHLLVGAMSLVQTTLARLLQKELADLAQAFEASLAWNKLILLQLDVLLLGYWLPPRQAS